MASWFKTGEDANTWMDEESERAQSESGFIRRWYMKKTPQNEDGKHIIFVDALKHPNGYKTPFVFLEHQLELNGRWTNWFTCIEGLEDAEGKPMVCPICAMGKKPSLCAAYTIIDRNPFTLKDGTVRNKDGNDLMLFVCKTKTQKILAKAARKREGLRGWLVEVTRTGSGTDSANVGDVFEFDQKTELKDDIQPFIYEDLFAPKTEAELRAIISGAAPAQAKADSPPVKADDDVVRF